MMKRFLACLLVVACLLSALALAEGESLEMKVIKCNTRVNIRQRPSVNADIVGSAPLGAVLVGCQKAAKGSDWYAVVYDGVAGYIRSDFLEPVGEREAPAPAEEAPAEEAAEPAPDASSDEVPEYDPAEEPADWFEEPADEAEAPADEPAEAPEAPATEPELVEEVLLPVDAQLPDEAPDEAPAAEPEAAETPVAAAVDMPAVENAPIASITDVTLAEGEETVINADAGAVHVIARRIMQEDREYLAVGGLDADGNQLWMHETATSGITELTLTDAFIGGIEARPLVMLYNAEQGLYAIDVASGNVRWLLGKDDIALGASISHAVAANGVMYIGGYYGPDPVAIDANGRVLWQASTGRDDIYWLNDIQLTGDGLVCAYDNMGGEGLEGTVIFDYSGAVKELANE